MENLETVRAQNRWDPEKTTEEPVEAKSSLSKSTIAFMTATALFFDAIQAILTIFEVGLIISPFISIFAGCVFFLWFIMNGVNMITPKRLSAMGGGFLTELIPAVDALPAWTAAVWYTIATTKIIETAEKLPGGKVVSMAVGSKINTVNASKASQIANTSVGKSTSFRPGGGQYAGTKFTENKFIQKNTVTPINESNTYNNQKQRNPSKPTEDHRKINFYKRKIQEEIENIQTLEQMVEKYKNTATKESLDSYASMVNSFTTINEEGKEKAIKKYATESITKLGQYYRELEDAKSKKIKYEKELRLLNQQKAA